jgi:hypothetical protein
MMVATGEHVWNVNDNAHLIITVNPFEKCAASDFTLDKDYIDLWFRNGLILRAIHHAGHLKWILAIKEEDLNGILALDDGLTFFNSKF